MTMTTTDLIQVIKDEMSRQGVTMYRLAQLTDLAQSSIRGYLKSNNMPSIDNYQKMVNALGLTIEVKRGEELSPPKSPLK